MSRNTADIIEYLKWRGDLPLSVSPMNEVDFMILCNVICVDMTPFFTEKEKSLTIGEISEKYFSSGADEKARLGALQPEKVLSMFKMLKDTPRFSNMSVSDYIYKIDSVAEEQFCAMCVDLGDGTRAVIYQGTDDTIVGWKENFNMSFLDSIPAQRDAAAYLEMIAGKYPEPIKLAGHSKGGNLSIYAAVHSIPEVLSRIIVIYNFDGPGFRREVIDTEHFVAIRDKLRSIVPQGSIIGMLMEREENYDVVRSDASGVYQHDGFSWEIQRDHFVHMETVTEGSKYLDKTITGWMNSLTIEERRDFIKDFFEVLSSTGAKTLSDLARGGFREFAALAENMNKLDDKKKDMMKRVMKMFFRSAVPKLTMPKISMPKLTPLKTKKRDSGGTQNAQD